MVWSSNDKIYPTSVDMVIIITYHASTEIMNSLHSMKIILSCTFPDGECIKFGLNVWFIYVKE